MNEDRNWIWLLLVPLLVLGYLLTVAAKAASESIFSDD